MVPNESTPTSAAPSAEGSSQTQSAPQQGAEGSTPQEGVKGTVASTAEKILKKYKVKVDEQEMEVDEDELLRGYQLRKASDKRFQEGMQARKQAETFINMLKTDPKKILTNPNLGLDFKKIAEEFLLEQMQEEMLDPKEKEIRNYKQKLSKYEEMEKKAIEEQKKALFDKQTQEARTKIEGDVVKALESSGLPKTEYTVKRMIHYMLSALEDGYKLSASDVVDLVQRDYIQDTKALYSNLDGEILLKLLGDDLANKIRKTDLERIKKPPVNAIKENVERPAEGTKEKKQWVSKDAWREQLNKKLG